MKNHHFTLHKNGFIQFHLNLGPGKYLVDKCGKLRAAAGNSGEFDTKIMGFMLKMMEFVPIMWILMQNYTEKDGLCTNDVDSHKRRNFIINFVFK